MVQVTLKKLDVDGNVVYTMALRNFRSWTLDLNFPVVATPLPQEDQKEQILLKLMGNNSSTKYSWVVKDETPVGSVVTEVSTIKTLPQQIEFWRSSMRPVSIEDSYKLEIAFSSTMVFEGTLDNVKFEMIGDAPVSATGSFNFMEGRVNGGIYELDTPSPPNSVTADSPAAGQLRQTWSASTDPGSSSISFWKFQYRLQGADAWTTVDVASGTFTNTKTGLSSGTYEARMLGANTQGNGQPSPIQTVTVA